MVDRVKLANKSFEELNELRLSIENNPNNKQDGFHRYKPYPRKKLDDLAWAVTNKLQRERVNKGGVRDGLY